ncbi:hypothetical protein EC968_002147 [Mortierella alpina]|nr:hypothetical protein EC968_002147 [Mortierella alpina]
MFLPWTPFILNIALAVFQLLLIGAIDAILAIYSRFGGCYANSIRWTRQGGYPEMLISVCNSWKNLPKPTRVAMIFTVLTSLAASFADKGAVYFITPSVKMDMAGPFVAKSSQFAARGLQRTFGGWIGSMRQGTDIVDAMTKMINDTRNIPGTIGGRLYAPRTSNYVTICDRIDLRAFNAPNLLLSNGGCTEVQYLLVGVFNADLEKARVVNGAKGRWSLTVPATSKVSSTVLTLLRTSLTMVTGRKICALGDPEPKLSTGIKPGLTALPKTSVTQCVFPTGEISVLSSTSVPFFVSPVTKFRSIANAVFAEYDGLLQAMEVSINSTTPTTNSTLFLELTSHDSFIEAVFCFSYGNPAISLSCVYNHINTFLIGQKEVDTLFTKARGGKPFPDPPVASIAMTIEHVPALLSGVPQPISISGMKNATFESAHFMALLGYNFYADYDEEQLYVLFDTMDPHHGFKIPDWLLISMTTTMVVCLALWGATKVLLNARYTSSLYKVVATQLSPQIGVSAPMLMRSRFKPFEFEHITVVAVAEEGLLEADAKGSLEHTSPL